LKHLAPDTFKQNIEFGNIHKNLLFGLCYLHAVLDGTRDFGPLGWHVCYDFDQNDFDISDSIINSYMTPKQEMKRSHYSIMNYIFGHVNFMRKISRMRTNANWMHMFKTYLMSKLPFHKQVRYDMDSSHFGFPSRDTDFNLYV